MRGGVLSLSHSLFEVAAHLIPDPEEQLRTFLKNIYLYFNKLQQL